MLKQIINNLKSLLKSKSGKVSLSESIEDDNYTQSDREYEDMMWDIVLFPANMIYLTGKGIYKGIKKASEFYQKYAKK